MRGAYIAQINRSIFVNNFLILAKGRSARLSRRRRRDFRPSRGNLPLARACARTDRRQIGSIKMAVEIVIRRLELIGYAESPASTAEPNYGGRDLQTQQNQAMAEWICQTRSFQSRWAPRFREAENGRSILVTPLGHEQRRSKHAGRKPHTPTGYPHRC